MATKSSPAPRNDPRDVFTGELDYANVTEFREKLLPVVNDLEANPTKRYLVTKHGKPLAVFLSFDAFEAIRKLVESVLEEEDEKPASRVLAEASRRMDRRRDAESLLESQVIVPVTTQLQALQEHMQRIELLLTNRRVTGKTHETRESTRR